MWRNILTRYNIRGIYILICEIFQQISVKRFADINPKLCFRKRDIRHRMENKKSYKDLRIIFMGTPEFAVASLEALVNSGCNIVAVITAPDKPAGRGMEMQQSAVKKYAVSKNLPVLQPEKLRDPQFLNEIRELAADLQICVAFRMLPQVVWDMPPLGTINLHGSLLPQYRGAAPINWAVINGEKETGVTTFKLQHEIDTGNILLQERLPIGEEEDAGSVHDRMKVLGAELLVNVTPLGMDGESAHVQSFSDAEVEAAAVVFDVVAFPVETPLIQAARRLGKPVITGGEVVALQAAEQFTLYTGHTPTPEQIIAAEDYASQ